MNFKTSTTERYSNSKIRSKLGFKMKLMMESQRSSKPSSSSRIQQQLNTSKRLTKLVAWNTTLFKSLDIFSAKTRKKN
jgi:hypothetical protein